MQDRVCYFSKDDLSLGHYLEMAEKRIQEVSKGDMPTDIEGIIEKLESGKYVVSYVTELTELEGGQKLVRFYDPSGNLIEVRTPINYN